MPEIPRYRRDPLAGPQIKEPGQLTYRERQPSPGAVSQSLIHAGRALEATGETINRIHVAHEQRRADHSKVEFQKSVTDFKLGLIGRQDYENFSEELNKHIEAEKNRYSGSIRDKGAQAELDNFISVQSDYAKREVALQAEQKRIDHHRAEIGEDLSTLSDLVMNTPSIHGRALLLKEAEVTLQNGEALGSLKAQEGFSEWRKFKKDMRFKISRYEAEGITDRQGLEAGISWLRDSNGQLTPEEEDALALPILQPEEVDALVSDLKTREAEKISTKKKEEEAHFDKVNTEFVKRMHLGTLRKEDILQAGLKPDGPMGTYWWLNVIDQRTRARLAGIDDPFVHSYDHAGLGELTQQALQNPGSLTDEVLWAKHGEGHSTKDLYQIAMIRDGKVSASTKANDLHKRWMSHLNWSRTNRVFKRGRSPAILQENNRIFMQLAEELGNMFATNPNITNDDVQEWWDARITPSERSALADLFDDLVRFVKGADLGEVAEIGAELFQEQQGGAERQAGFGLLRPRRIRRTGPPQPPVPQATPEEEALPLPEGVTEASVMRTAKKYGHTRNQVIKNILAARGR